jgi:hypothetical protein
MSIRKKTITHSISKLYTIIFNTLDKHLIPDIIDLVLLYVNKTSIKYITTVSGYQFDKLLVYDDMVYIYCENEKMLYELIINPIAVKKFFDFSCIVGYDPRPVQFIDKNIIMIYIKDHNYIFYNINTLQIIKKFEKLCSLAEYITANNKYIIISKFSSRISVFDINKMIWLCDININGILSGICKEFLIIDDIIYVTVSNFSKIYTYNVFGDLINSINIAESINSWKSTTVRITNTEITTTLNQRISFYDFDGVLINSQKIDHSLYQNHHVTKNNIYVINRHQIHIYERII